MDSISLKKRKGPFYFTQTKILRIKLSIIKTNKIGANSALNLKLNRETNPVQLLKYTTKEAITGLNQELKD
jgi:hypothetical protein